MRLILAFLFSGATMLAAGAVIAFSSGDWWSMIGRGLGSLFVLWWIVGLLAAEKVIDEDEEGL